MAAEEEHLDAVPRRLWQLQPPRARWAPDCLRGASNEDEERDGCCGGSHFRGGIIGLGGATARCRQPTMLADRIRPDSGLVLSSPTCRWAPDPLPRSPFQPGRRNSRQEPSRPHQEREVRPIRGRRAQATTRTGGGECPQLPHSPAAQRTMGSFRTTEDYARFRLAEDSRAADRDRGRGSQKLVRRQAQTTPVRISPAKLKYSIQWFLLGGHAAEGLLAHTTLLALSDALSGSP